MKDKIACIDDLKKQYEPLRKKYNLPEFSKLNEEFEIEKIQEKETEFLLREIRRVISEKIAAFLRFFELFINPQSAPVFILTSLKNLTPHEKDLIEKLYKELVNIELAAVSLDIIYKETREAQFIKDITKRWQNMKQELEQISEMIAKMPREGEKKGKSYFG